MALDTRRCFWFGTEDRAGFFATPLKGADSSPSAWGVDGTLLNGGGYAFNSFGSHKRYNYEWPQSSSPETAQMMKSYRDGTYGRGLLYFLEPGIYRTNILPAHWADPSMSLNNEAPSLVYGVDPIAVPTSGGDHLNLPINSAQYDLSSVPVQTVPTPDSSVFLPVPTGHTLFLGAFYSSTGTGGVFVTPINNNGTLGTSVKLTEKSNADTDVVVDRFEGDIKGVRIWVGRSSAVDSSLTLAAMTGRLMETVDTVTYGPWVESRRNRAVNPEPATLTGWTAIGSTNSTISGHLQGLVTAPSVAATIPRSQVVGVPGAVPVNAGDPFYIRVEFKHSRGLPMQVRAWFMDSSGVSISNVAGPSISTNPSTFTETSVTGTVPVGATLMGYQVIVRSDITPSDAGDTYEVRRITTDPGGYFYGGTAGDELHRYSWVGAVNNSASLEETRTLLGNPAKQAKIVSGPWIGGQGHSGCRFVGTPSYVNNGPVEGGRVGFAASFVEVGSWVYG